MDDPTKSLQSCVNATGLAAPCDSAEFFSSESLLPEMLVLELTILMADLPKPRVAPRRAASSAVIITLVGGVADIWDGFTNMPVLSSFITEGRTSP